jgi:hypothetical protein
MRAAAAGPLDWPLVLRIAKRHQVIALVHEGLTRVQSDAPSDIVREISTQAATQARKNLMMARESLRLGRLFDDAKLPAVFVKGAALAILAFGNLGLRASQDIDLLVPYDALPLATSLLLRVGYRRFDPPPEISEAQLRLVMPFRKDLGFVDESTGLRIELHWRLFLNPHAMDETSITTASRFVPLAGTAGLRTLGDEDLFTYLCLHGALHWWNRLKWLADVNALLASVPDEGFERLIRAAQARGAERAAAQALLLCRRLLATPLPDRLIATFARGPAIRWLQATALSAMATGQGDLDPHDVRFGTTRGSLSTFLLRRSRRYRLAELYIQMTNQTDVLTLPLWKRLWFLYPVLRLPFWIWRHARR